MVFLFFVFWGGFFWGGDWANEVGGFRGVCTGTAALILGAWRLLM